MGLSDSLLKGYNIVRADEAGPTYNYYAHMRSDGSALIQRATTTGTEFKYALWPDGTYDTFDDFWAARTSLTYAFPFEFPNK